MTASQHEPAQRIFVHRLVDWQRIRRRLECYPAISRTFPLETMKNCCESSPYYCHYMSWRLGTLEPEDCFQRLEELLLCAEALPNWEHEKRSFVNSSDFPLFWSLVWQLQVAEHLCSVGTNVRWAKTSQGQPSPDLSVEIDGERWSVECSVPRKSFGLLRFLKEVLLKLDDGVRITYDPCLRFDLPKDSNSNGFLDQVLAQFLDPNRLAMAKEDAEKQHPVVLYKDPGSSLYIYVDGERDYMPGVVPNQTGDPKAYVELVLEEAVNAKQWRNGLAERHPNLLAVNYVLGDDYQIARMLPKWMQTLKLPEIGPNIDALAGAAVDEYERLTWQKLEVIVQSREVEGSSLGRRLASL